MVEVVQPPLFFIHIPKSAGTSVRKMLYEIYPSTAIFPNIQAIRKRPNIYHHYQLFHEQLKQLESEPTLLMGHLPFHPIEGIPGLQYFTFLRDPVKRALSNLKHFQRHHERFRGKSLLEIYNAPDIRVGQVENIQVKYFAPGEFDDTVVGWKKQAVDSQRLETAKENLSQCALVGITEEFDTSIELANRIFGWDTDHYKRFNTAPPKQARELNPRLLELLKQSNQYDIEFYQFGLTLFEQLKKKHHL